MRCKEKIYQKIAEQVMTTYKDGIQVYCGRDLRTHKPYYHSGFSVMGREISYGRVKTDIILMSLIVPRMKNLYQMDEKDSEQIFHLIKNGIRERVRMRLLLNKLENELQ